MTEIKQDVDSRFAPVELRARQEARREIRVLSDKIRDVGKNHPEDSSADRASRLDLYTEQLDMAQNDFDTYDED